MTKLFDRLTLRSVTLHNLALSPMCQYEAEDGFVTTYHAVHYGCPSTAEMRTNSGLSSG